MATGGADLNRWRRELKWALVGMAGTLALLFAVAGQPATAVVALDVAGPVEQAATPAAQTVTVEADVATPAATRDSYSVTLFTVVQWPVSNRTVSSGFGYRVSPCHGCSSDHQGVDFDAGGGNPVMVVADGVVTEATCGGGLGCHVIVQHTQLEDGSRFDTVYGHMQFNSITVGVGSVVDRGTVLGLVGSTGASTGNHLHFEVRPGGGAAIDPVAWLLREVNV